MDAPEDDSDVRLQKVAGDLIGDFDRSLEPFLFRRRAAKTATTTTTTTPTTTTTTRTVRARVRTRDAQRMAGLLDPFQEYPQLLDSHLARWLPLLADAFLASVATTATISHPMTDTHDVHGLTQSLQAAVALLLYTLCKVRGEKVVVGFLPVATRHLEPLLGALERGGAAGWSWQERYVVLLWLAQLLLAPFDLATISTAGGAGAEEEDDDVMEGEESGHDDDDKETSSEDHDPFVWPAATLPSITVRVLPLARRYLAAPGKERDAARALLVRLAMRRDMQQLGVRDALVAWALGALTPGNKAAAPGPAAGPYYYIGVLSFLAGLLSAAAGTSDMDDSLEAIFRTVHAVAEEEEEDDNEADQASRALFASIRSSAVARKTMVKALRAVAVRCIQKEQQQQQPSTAGGVSALPDDAVEATIGYLLGRLADNDTPVRFAASKALGIITLRLAPDRAAEVIDAVLDALERNVLYTVSGVGGVGGTPVADLTAVDPLEWHGLMLTLAHLLYRRAPPLAALPAVAAALLRGLAFERRSLSGSATGTNVRDAACFGIWALARRYATAEVVAAGGTSQTTTTTTTTPLLQTLATHLVVAAALDPASNIRRGSSAALQELVGRHPDTVCCGIALVQAVDYHAVALRARAARDVAGAAAALAPRPYGAALLRDGLLGWRGLADAADAGARRVAAASFGHIAALLAAGGGGARPLAQTVDELVARLRDLQPRQVEERHGLLLALAAVLDEVPALAAAQAATTGDNTPALAPLHAVLDACRDAAAAASGPAQRRPDLLAEAACRLIVSSFPVVQAAILPHAAPSSLLSGPTLVAEAGRVPPSAVFSDTVAALDTAAVAAAATGPPAAVRAYTDLVASCLSAADPTTANDNSSAAWLARQEPDVVAATSDAALVLLVLLSPPGGAEASSSAEDARGDLLRAWANVVSKPGAAGPVRSRYMMAGGGGGGGNTGPGAKLGAGTAGSGYVFALTKALPLVTAVHHRKLSSSTTSPPPILQAILDRWAADRAIDTRVALLQALAQSPAVLTTTAGPSRTALRAVLAAGLDDYTTDARGDVGSLVRLQALRATQVLWRGGGGDGDGDDDDDDDNKKAPLRSNDMLLLRVLRLAAEKLDRVRVAAQAALVQALAQGGEGEGGEGVAAAAAAGHRLGAQTFSSQAYFRCLLELLDAVVPAGGEADTDAAQLRWMAALMRGYATSADTGNEELVVASRAALVDFLAGEEGDGKRRRRSLVWRALLRNLPGGVTAAKKPIVPPDRIVVPTLELAAFLFYAGTVPDAADADHAALCGAVRQAADKAGSVRKVEACVKVYGAVAAAAAEPASPGAAEARRQLAALLQHPWPRVRAAVVDELWGLGLRTAGGGGDGPYAALKGVDWAAAEPAATAALAGRLGLVQ